MTTLVEGTHAGGFLVWEAFRDYTRETITVASGTLEKWGSTDEQGLPVVRYRSGLDLLRRTLDFYETVCTTRFEEDFGGVHRYIKPLFDGRNPYMISLEKNLFYLRRVLRGERWPLLRRSPPCVLAEGESVERTRVLVAERLRAFRSTDAA